MTARFDKEETIWTVFILVMVVPLIMCVVESVTAAYQQPSTCRSLEKCARYDTQCYDTFKPLCEKEMDAAQHK